MRGESKAWLDGNWSAESAEKARDPHAKYGSEQQKYPTVPPLAVQEPINLGYTTINIGNCAGGGVCADERGNHDCKWVKAESGSEVASQSRKSGASHAAAGTGNVQNHRHRAKQRAKPQGCDHDKQRKHDNSDATKQCGYPCWLAEASQISFKSCGKNQKPKKM